MAADRDGIRLTWGAAAVTFSMVAAIISGSIAYGAVTEKVSAQKERTDKIDEVLIRLSRSDTQILERLASIEANLAMLLKAQGLMQPRRPVDN